jgi:co-chaperonin GroES (HSP10)
MKVIAKDPLSVAHNAVALAEEMGAKLIGCIVPSTEKRDETLAEIVAIGHARDSRGMKRRQS